MGNLQPWSIFPPNLDPPAARSLSFLFLLEELLATFTLVEQLPLTCSEESLEKFLLFSLENPLTQKGGTLDKLCFYCDILLQASERSEGELLVLLDQMRSCVLHFKSDPKKGATSFQKQITEKLRAFFTALHPFFEDARTDENILMRLLEKRDCFNRFLGPRTVENLLHDLFPLGVEELRLVMSQGYARRGFEDFFSAQESLIDALEWETPCDPLLQTL